MFKISIKKKFKKFNKILIIKDPKQVVKNLKNKNQKNLNIKHINYKKKRILLLKKKLNLKLKIKKFLRLKLMKKLFKMIFILLFITNKKMIIRFNMMMNKLI